MVSEIRNEIKNFIIPVRLYFSKFIGIFYTQERSANINFLCLQKSGNTERGLGYEEV